MVQINFAQKEIQCKIVYYGPGMSGKTTNLELVHSKVPGDNRGELTSIATTGERTLYFDYMPLDLGQIAGISTKFQLYTVPGQIYYKSTRRLVLQGVDGIVFVADSSAAKLRENKESLEDLEQNLKEMGKTLSDIPIVIQYNKRDLPDAMSIDDLESELNPHGFPYTEAIASSGDGVFPTLKDLSQRVLEAVNKGGLSAQKQRGTPRPTAVKAPAQEPAMASAGVQGAGAAGAGAPPSTDSTAVGTAHGVHATGGPPSGPPGSDQGSVASVAPAPSAPAAGGSMEGDPSPPPSYHKRAIEDRVVRVDGLGAGGSSRWGVILALAALIGAAAYFVVTKFL